MLRAEEDTAATISAWGCRRGIGQEHKVLGAMTAFFDAEDGGEAGLEEKEKGHGLSRHRNEAHPDDVADGREGGRDAETHEAAAACLRHTQGPATHRCRR